MLSNLISVAMVALTVGVILLFFSIYFYRRLSPDLHWRQMRRAARAAGEELPDARTPFSFNRMPFHPMEKRDRLPLLLVTVIYLAITLFNLGSHKAPQTFLHLTRENPEAVVELDNVYELSDLWYYTGLYSGASCTLSYSADGQTWLYPAAEDIFQKYNTLFKWQDPELDVPMLAKYVRFQLIDGEDLALGELALFDSAGNQIPAQAYCTGTTGDLLVDEQDVVPEAISWKNSTYFDEIYHARTAYEHLQGVYPYENSHPPLGKLIMAVGIALFGMNPFGWRIMGALFGAAMLPILYVFLKNLFGKTPVAVCGTLLFAYDFMHFAQTRIATIDTYSVIFVLLSFFFLYRYFVVPRSAGLKKELLPLFLCGLFFGIGAASKWTVIYAGAGLCILYFWNLILRGRESGWNRAFFSWMWKTLLASVAFFVVIPLVIYTLSYLPYSAVSGEPVWKEMLDNQVFMFTYHNGVHQEHPYSSRWWQWILDIRPILYYVNYFEDGTKSAIASFGSPMVVWGGLLALFVLLYHSFHRRSSAAVFLFLGWLVQLLPWVIIGRTTFEYHYFGCILFLSMAVTFVMNDLWELTQGRARALIYAYTGYSVALFALFYPVLSGLRVSRWFCEAFLKWFPTWPLG